MHLQSLMATYPESEKFKEKFPRLWEYASKVEVIDWQEEFAVEDYNPEVIDEIDFLRMLLKSGMITQEDYIRKVKTLPVASKTLAVAFMDEDKVSFRSKRPPFSVLVHELGHCYFKVPDRLWSSEYAGGESILWLIYHDRLEGDEDTVKAWIDLLKLSYEDREKAMAFLDEFAIRVANKYGMDFRKYFEVEERPIVELMKWAGTIPEESMMPFAFYVNLVEGVRWRDPHYDTFAEELFEELKRREIERFEGPSR